MLGRLRPGEQLPRSVALGCFLIFSLDVVVTLRLNPLDRITPQENDGVSADDVFREVLSPLSTLCKDISPLVSKDSSVNSTAHFPLTELLGDVKLSTAERLHDPSLATVFSPQATRRLPRLARGTNLPLTPHRGNLINVDHNASEKKSQRHQLPIGSVDPPPPKLDAQEALIAGQLASIAYCSHPDLLAAWNCSRCASVPGFTPYRIVYDTVWDLAAYVGYYTPWDAVVLSFRGTDSSNWGQWAENMRAWRTDHMYPVPDFPHALIHAGFYTLWTGSMLQTTFTAAVSELMVLHPGARLVAVGHSMGGALAQLAGLEFKLFYNSTLATVYTFGAPRVGNLAYQQLFNSFVDISWRFTHNRDIVPSVPLQMMGFQHVAREVWEVDVEGPSGTGGGVVERKLLLCDGTGEDPSCHNSACYLGLCTSIADHLVYLGLHMYQDDDEC